MKQWGVNYWGTYSLVVNWIIVRYLLEITSVHEFTSRPIDFILEFPQADIYFYVFVELSYGMAEDGNRGKWVLKINKSLYGLKQARKIVFNLLR